MVKKRRRIELLQSQSKVVTLSSLTAPEFSALLSSGTLKPAAEKKTTVAPTAKIPLELLKSTHADINMTEFGQGVEGD